MEVLFGWGKSRIPQQPIRDMILLHDNARPHTALGKTGGNSLSNSGTFSLQSKFYIPTTSICLYRWKKNREDTDWMTTQRRRVRAQVAAHTSPLLSSRMAWRSCSSMGKIHSKVRRLCRKGDWCIFFLVGSIKLNKKSPDYIWFTLVSHFEPGWGVEKATSP